MTDADFSGSTYNSGLMVLMNFNNVGTLGETSSVVRDFSPYNDTGTSSNGSRTSAGKFGG